MFLRFKLGSLDRIIPVICQGITQPGNLLVVQWTEDSAQFSQVPPEAMAVQCQILYNGELFLATGEFAGNSSGRLPRVRIRISENCVGIKLRRQQRYAVRGKLEILESCGAVIFAHNTYQKMNIALGGFGIRVPELVAATLKYTGFRFEALVEREAQPDESYPALVIEGEAELRHCAPSSQEGMIYAGFRFSRLSDIATGTLQFWLAAHGQVLRAL